MKKFITEILGTPITYKGMSQVKDSKISILVHLYELFKMEDRETIDKIFGCFQTIINNLISLVKALRASKDLKKIPMKELLGTLKVHEIVLRDDEGQRKGKSIVLKRIIVQSLQITIKTSSLSYLERSIPYGRRREDLDGRTTLRSSPKRPKIRVKWYATIEKPEHFKSECLNLENEKDTKKPFLKKKKYFEFFQKENEILKKENKILKEVVDLKDNTYEFNEKLQEVVDLKESLAKFTNLLPIVLNYGKFGHLSYDYRDCPKLSRLTRKDPKIFGGFSCHITRERSMLQDLRPKSRGWVNFGGRITRISKIVKHIFSSIDNVLYVEGLKHNLLSISQLCNIVYNVFFNKEECIVKNVDGSLLFSTKRQNNLYKINLTNLSNQSVTCLVFIKDDHWIWHKKLGHASLRLISNLSKHHLVRGLSNLVFKSYILYGKQVKTSFESKNIVSTYKPLKLLHIDLFGPTRTIFMSGK
ncbi:hypothetical protein CR513_51174, partial [Mucuna pruriens]